MANAYIARCGYDEVKDYRNKGLVAKVGSKKYKVYLRIFCDDFNLMEAIQFARNNPMVVMLEYQGSVENVEYSSLTTESVGFCYISRLVEQGLNITEEDVVSVLNGVPSGVVPIIKLPDTFSDLKFVSDMCKKYDRVRFCGGNLFRLDGCRLGCCGEDILCNKGIKSNGDFYTEGCSCGLDVVDLSMLDIEVTDKVERTTKSISSRSSKSGSAPKKQKQLLFADLLKSGGAVSL